MAEINSRQKRAVVALLSSRNIQEAAQSAQIGERTLYRWLATPAFRLALLSAEEEAIDNATRRLISLQDMAIATLYVLLRSDEEPSSLKLRAIQTVLDYVLKFRELRNFEQRLLELEEIVYENQY